MRNMTASVVDPATKRIYDASYVQAENVGELEDVIKALGLSLDEVNFGLHRAKRAQYLTALESGTDPETKIANLKADLLTKGFDSEEAHTIAESRRAKYEKDGALPSGLTLRIDASGKPVLSKRLGPGAKKAEAS